MELIRERGEADFKSEVQRFPRLFQSVETVPGLTFPNLVFKDRMTLWLGKREIQISYLGNGHTRGDTVVWLPQERVLFSGDLVETGATPYTGDAYLGDWVQTLDRLRELKPEKLVPGRGEALIHPPSCLQAIDQTQRFLKMLQLSVKEGLEKQESLKQIFHRAREALLPQFGGWVIFEHCLPFNVSRAYDELSGIQHPRVWTEKRDLEMWNALQS
jgi:glyoxylase-like metal-dependent hydrolase (beta-lactamase superfamily II)